MGDKSAISWCDATWNPVVGCTRVSPGCEHCYASTLHNHRYRSNVKAALELTSADSAAFAIAEMRQALRDREYNAYPLPFPAQYDVPFNRVQLKPERLALPLRWIEPKRIFVNSMSDLFHEDVPFEFIGRVFAVMGLAGHHVFQVLTKRPERALEFFAQFNMPASLADLYVEEPRIARRTPLTAKLAVQVSERPLPNVWIGVSAENQEQADLRIPQLLRIPASVRFVSCEPLLGPIDIRPWISPIERCQSCGELYEDVWYANNEAWNRVVDPQGAGFRCPSCFDREAMVAGVDYDMTFLGEVNSPLDWVIVGGESGPKHRPLEHAWVHAIRESCMVAGVAYFGKQDAGARSEIPLPGELGEREFPR